MKQCSGEQVRVLYKAHVALPSLADTIHEKFVEFRIVRAPPNWLIEVSDERAVGTTVRGRQHPTDAHAYLTTTGEGPQQAVLSVVVYVSEVLVLHCLEKPLQ